MPTAQSATGQCAFLASHAWFWLKPFDIPPKAQIARLIRNNNAAPLLFEACTKWRRRTPSLFAARGDRLAAEISKELLSTAKGHTLACGF
jgi:hypothetical protein